MRSSAAIADEVLRSAGAILGGRRWYDIAERLYNGVEGIYGGGWRGPVFVLTHRPPDEAAEASVTFLSVPLAEAVATARTAANAKNVVIFGANLAQQCLREGPRRDRDPPRAGVAWRWCTAPRANRRGPIVLTRTDVAVTGQLTDLRFRV